MTYRIYARWPPGQFPTHKTNTASKAIADAAWIELKNTKWEDGKKPIGLAYTCNGKQVDYVDLTKQD